MFVYLKTLTSKPVTVTDILFSPTIARKNHKFTKSNLIFQLVSKYLKMFLYHQFPCPEIMV